MNLECNGYAGHKWSQIPPGIGFWTNCTRCKEWHPIHGYKEPETAPTSILNGKPIPDNLVVGADPRIEYNLSEIPMFISDAQSR